MEMDRINRISQDLQDVLLLHVAPHFILLILQNPVNPV